MRQLWILSCLFLSSSFVLAAPNGKVINLSITNPTKEVRRAENIVVSIADLKAVARDFSAGSAIVMASDASKVEDTANSKSVELPSQADDINGDGKYDEIAFQIDLQPSQTRIVTISYGDHDTGFRLRNGYPKRAHAKFTTKYEGMGWESDLTAWRIYFDKRNAIDLFGKKQVGLYLDTFGSPEYDYHKDSAYGRDIYKNGDALGIGSIGALVDGKPVKVSDVSERKWRIISDGPVRAIVELTYTGWKIGDKTVDLVSRITQWAGDRGFDHKITAKNADGITLVAGLPRKPEIQQIKFEEGSTPTVYAFGTWGHQVLKPGASAVDSLPDQNLGLGLLVSNANQSSFIDNDPANFLIRLPLKEGSATWYVTAAWDQEGSDNSKAGSKTAFESCMLNASKAQTYKGITTKEGFTSYLKEKSQQLSSPSRISVLSNITSTTPQAASFK
jgi:hypothetical protein